MAADIIRGIVAPACIAFKHYSSEVQVPFSRLAEHIERLYGGTFTLVSMHEWIASTVELGIEELIMRYLETNIAGGGRLIFPYMGRSS